MHGIPHYSACTVPYYSVVLCRVSLTSPPRKRTEYAMCFRLPIHIWRHLAVNCSNVLHNALMTSYSLMMHYSFFAADLSRARCPSFRHPAGIPKHHRSNSLTSTPGDEATGKHWRARIGVRRSMVRLASELHPRPSVIRGGTGSDQSA